jgi:hypothetical protein
MSQQVSELYACYSDYFDRLEDDIRRTCGPLSATELRSRWGERLSRQEFEEIWRRISRDEHRAREWTARLCTAYEQRKKEMEQFVDELFAVAQDRIA